MSQTMIGPSNLQKLQDIKTDIKCLLISEGSKDVTLPQLNQLYKHAIGDNIPFKDFYYTSLKDFLNSMPDTVHLKYNSSKLLCVYHIKSEKSKHISDLIAKEKKRSLHSNNDRHRSKYVRIRNPVDPSILYEVLQEFMTVSEKDKGISKAKVLSKIIECIGKYSFYTMQDLTSQLNELTHLLTHDDEYIYIKYKLFKTEYPKQKNQRQLKREIYDCNDCSLQNKEAKNYCNNSENNKIQTRHKNSVGDIIKNSTKVRLQKLIAKHSEGIWCSDLPRVYLHEYGLELEYSDLGFNSIIEFVAALSDIFLIKTVNGKRQMVIDAKIPTNTLQNQQMMEQVTNKEFLENIENVLEPIPTKLSLEVSKTLIPNNAMELSNNVDQILVSSLFDKPEKSVKVIVSEIQSPSYFWVTLHKNKSIINKLMHQLEEFYTQPDLDKYKIPQILIRVGLNVACKFDEMWHRGIIQAIESNNIVVNLYDFGTITLANISQLYFLNDKFSLVPVQAIPCCLYNVKPIGKPKWSTDIIEKFIEKVMEKSFVASILSINKENNSMMVNLIDANDSNQASINEWIIRKKLAQHGQLVCQIDNFTFSCYLECTKQHVCDSSNKKHVNNHNDTEINHTSCDIQNNFSQKYTSTNKKLDILRNYKEKFLNASQSPLSDSNRHTDNSEDEKQLNEIIFTTSNNLTAKQLLDNRINELCDKNESNDNINQSESDVINEFSISSSDYSSSTISSNESSYEEIYSNKLLFKSGDVQPTKLIVDCDDRSSGKVTSSHNKKSFDLQLSAAVKELQILIACTKLK